MIAMLGLLSFTNQPKRTKILFFGDSITQQGIGKNGYISKMDSLIKLQGLGDNYELLGAGIGGNKVYDIYYHYVWFFIQHISLKCYVFTLART